MNPLSAGISDLSQQSLENQPILGHISSEKYIIIAYQVVPTCSISKLSKAVQSWYSGTEVFFCHCLISVTGQIFLDYTSEGTSYTPVNLLSRKVYYFQRVRVTLPTYRRTLQQVSDLISSGKYDRPMNVLDAVKAFNRIETAQTCVSFVKDVLGIQNKEIFTCDELFNYIKMAESST